MHSLTHSFALSLTVELIKKLLFSTGDPTLRHLILKNMDLLQQVIQCVLGLAVLVQDQGPLVDLEKALDRYHASSSHRKFLFACPITK